MNNDTEDLITWLRAQLDNEERLALAANADDPGPWRFDGDYDPTEGKIRDANGYTVVHVEDSTPRPDTAEHIARWDPARVLAEVNAKRALLKVIIEYEQTVSGDSGFTVGELADTSALLILAQPYAGQPGWREEWKPV